MQRDKRTGRARAEADLAMSGIWKNTRPRVKRGRKEGRRGGRAAATREGRIRCNMLYEMFSERTAGSRPGCVGAPWLCRAAEPPGDVRSNHDGVCGQRNVLSATNKIGSVQHVVMKVDMFATLKEQHEMCNQSLVG